MDAALRSLAAVGGDVLVEELLEGPEVSLFALCDGREAMPLPSARDFKRAYDGDEGPNTGGMGAYAPVPDVGPDAAAELVERIHRPVLDELERRGAPFVGLLYAGLMLTADGPRCSSSTAGSATPRRRRSSRCSTATCSRRSPAAAARESRAATCICGRRRRRGDRRARRRPAIPAEWIEGRRSPGIEDAEAAGALVFHAGTALQGERLVTNGGRIVASRVSARRSRARALRAEAAVERIEFSGMRHRTDIAAAAPRCG